MIHKGGGSVETHIQSKRDVLLILRYHIAKKNIPTVNFIDIFFNNFHVDLKARIWLVLCETNFISAEQGYLYEKKFCSELLIRL